MTRALVTGGGGFIGSHLVEGATALGWRVRVLDNFSTGLRDNYAAVQPAPETIAADLTDAVAVNDAVAGCEVVFHLGALASVARSVENPTATHHACATGTLHVLDAARRHGVRRVVYAGSSSAYGGGDDQTETALPAPQSPYAAAKLAGEMYFQAFAGSFGLDGVVLRFFNVFGPRQRYDSPYSGVIALFIDAMMRGQAPTIHGDGLQSRDFTYVADTVQALLKAAQAPKLTHRVYNVGTGRSQTVLDLVAALNRLLGTHLTPKHESPRVGDVRHSRADIQRLQQDLDYASQIPFEEGLRRTIEWYRKSAAC